METRRLVAPVLMPPPPLTELPAGPARHGVLLTRSPAALTALRLVVALAGLAVGLTWRWPWQASLRPWLLAGVPAAAVLLLVLELRRRGARRSRLARATAGVTIIAAALALSGVLIGEVRFRIIRHRVLSAEPERLARLGRHLVVGYRDVRELEALLARRAVGGVFVTWWNAEGKDAAAIAAELGRFQALRARTGEPPLWIAADQEGGAVSRLSPPLAPLPRLRSVAPGCEPGPDGCADVARYAADQAAGLVSLGVNLDLAPVVDLDHHLAGAGGRFTRITRRAIGSDPAQVARVADAYCAALVEAGVACALKHFPGLGRVMADTHRYQAALTTATAELAATDWVPFRDAGAGPARFVMLAHAQLAAVDPARPASTSRRVVDLLRRDLGVGGPIVTDDFSMMALFRSRPGVGQGAVDALAGGVDLVLVSNDPDQYYLAMDALLRADREGRLDRATLRVSEERLAAARAALNGMR